MQTKTPDKVVLSLGRLHPLKGLDLLVSAWAEVKRRSKVLKCESAKVGAEATENSNTAENFRTLELSNFRTASWQLVIAGPDEQGTMEKLKGISEKLNLKWCESEEMGVEGDADIIFMGPVHGEKKWELMQRANIFVLPSRSENFGMVVGEALSCGVPVVTTAVGPWGEGSGEMRECVNAGMRECGNARMRECGNAGMRECGNAGMRELEVLTCESAKVGGERSLSCADRGKGLFVVETSVEGIAEGLRQMMMLSDAERMEMGLKGCGWVKREFSWGSVAQKMVVAYEAAMR